MSKPADLVKFTQSKLRALADPEKAQPMAAYMKTEAPFYGVQKPDRVPIYREMKMRFAPQTQEEYLEGVSALWQLPYREEKYTAVEYATMFDKFISMESMQLYERMIREGQWWDFVDAIAIPLVGGVLQKNRAKMERLMDKWIDDRDMWIRRTAILSQNRHKKETNEEMLFRYCLQRAHEKEFFIRKAIGWALREYSYSAPSAVSRFIKQHKHELSPLSIREGAKQLIRSGNFKL